MMTDNIQQLTHYLSLTASKEQVNQILSRLLNSLKASTVGNDATVMAACYKMVLEGLPYPVLRQACEDITHGRAEGLSKTFMPSTAELRQYCEGIEKEAQSQIRYAQSLLAAPEEAARGERVSPERAAELWREISKASTNQTRH